MKCRRMRMKVRRTRMKVRRTRMKVSGYEMVDNRWFLEGVRRGGLDVRKKSGGDKEAQQGASEGLDDMGEF